MWGEKSVASTLLQAKKMFSSRDRVTPVKINDVPPIDTGDVLVTPFVDGWPAEGNLVPTASKLYSKPIPIVQRSPGLSLDSSFYDSYHFYLNIPHALNVTSYAVVWSDSLFAFGRAVLLLFSAPHFRLRRKCGAERAFLPRVRRRKRSADVPPRNSC